MYPAISHHDTTKFGPFAITALHMPSSISPGATLTGLTTGSGGGGNDLAANEDGHQISPSFAASHFGMVTIILAPPLLRVWI